MKLKLWNNVGAVTGNRTEIETLAFWISTSDKQTAILRIIYYVNNRLFLLMSGRSLGKIFAKTSDQILLLVR
jgi:hypothetical protein